MLAVRQFLILWLVLRMMSYRVWVINIPLNGMSALSWPGREYDKNGVLRQWWGPGVIRRFSRAAVCFVEQYNKYKSKAGEHVSIRSLLLYMLCSYTRCYGQNLLWSKNEIIRCNYLKLHNAILTVFLVLVFSLIFSAHLTLLERAIAVDVCLSVHLSVKRMHPDKTK